MFPLDPLDRNLSGINKKITSLLVEDDQPLLEFFSTILRREGYEVITAANGVEALEISKDRPEEHIDVLLTDVAMPYMGGVQMAVALRAPRPDIRVFLTSGLPVQEVAERCGSTLELDFLAKPFLVADLTERMLTLTEVL